MSRIGKKAVAVPKGVTADVSGQSVKVKGPKGELSFLASDDVEVKFADGKISVEPRSESKRARAAWGMSRTMVQNLMRGVTEGFERRLEISGVGYRAAVAGKNLQLNLGYSHDVLFPIPAGITIQCPRPTEIVVTGADRQKVGQVAAEIRQYRKPEPYKGKGVKYSDEYVHRKEGKKK
jgi:large subunit ribosomal protein L6